MRGPESFKRAGIETNHAGGTFAIEGARKAAIENAVAPAPQAFPVPPARAKTRRGKIGALNHRPSDDALGGKFRKRASSELALYFFRAIRWKNAQRAGEGPSGGEAHAGDESLQQSGAIERHRHAFGMLAAGMRQQNAGTRNRR